jgi:hypothetical protein
MHEDVEFSMKDETVRCRVKEGWHEEGRLGWYYGAVAVNGRYWALVQWDTDDDPDLYKVEGLEVMKEVWGDPE